MYLFVSNILHDCTVSRLRRLYKLDSKESYTGTKYNNVPLSLNAKSLRSLHTRQSTDIKTGSELDPFQGLDVITYLVWRDLQLESQSAQPLNAMIMNKRRRDTLVELYFVHECCNIS